MYSYIQLYSIIIIRNYWYRSRHLIYIGKRNSITAIMLCNLSSDSYYSSRSTSRLYIDRGYIALYPRLESEESDIIIINISDVPLTIFIKPCSCQKIMCSALNLYFSLLLTGLLHYHVEGILCEHSLKFGENHSLQLNISSPLSLCYQLNQTTQKQVTCHVWIVER